MTWSAAARIAAWSGILPGLGRSASTYLGRTAGATWVRYLGCVPPATMRALRSRISTKQRSLRKIRCLQYIITKELACQLYLRK